MKFRDFLLKTLLADTDYLVGYDADGKYIRISKADLAQSVAGAAAALVPVVAIQYSADGSNWHDTNTSGDKYFRLKVGSTGGAALKAGMSAYDVWKALGNSGSEADFIASLKGEPGAGADLSSLRLQNIDGYTELLQQVNNTIVQAKMTIIEEVTAAAMNNVTEQFVDTLASKLNADLSNIADSSVLSDESYIPVVSGGELKKVKMETVAAYTEMKSIAIQQMASAKGASSQQSESSGSASPSSSGVFDVTVTTDLWEENDIWQYVAIVEDENAARLRSAFASPASETLQEWSDCPITLVAIEDGILVFASPKALPTESITMKVYYTK